MTERYMDAWKAFIEGTAGKRLLDHEDVPARMYRENRIRCAFDAGWNARSEIAERETAEAADRWIARIEKGSTGPTNE